MYIYLEEEKLRESEEVVDEIFPQTNEMPPCGFKLKRKLFMKRGKMNHLIKIGKTHRFIKEVLSEKSILLDRIAELII